MIHAYQMYMEHVYCYGNRVDGPNYERGTGFLLSRLGSLAARSWSVFLSDHALNPSQYAVLVVLAEQGGLDQRSLAHAVAVDARNLVAVLDSVASRGLVARVTDPRDRRRRLVALTASGTELVRTLAANAAAGQDDFLGALDALDQDRLNVLLQRVYDGHRRRRARE
jgi:DNA-binding MarR family transcriptional regulator